MATTKITSLKSTNIPDSTKTQNSRTSAQHPQTHTQIVLQEIERKMDHFH